MSGQEMPRVGQNVGTRKSTRQPKRRQASVHSHWKSKAEARRADLYKGLFKHVLYLIVTLLVGTFAMMWFENWSFIDSMYFAVVTATTVGLGDEVPTYTASRLFVSVFMIFSVYFVANAMAYFASLPLELRRETREHEVLTQFGVNLLQSELDTMIDSGLMNYLRRGDANRHDQHGEPLREVSKAEFMLWLLVKQGKVDRESIHETACAFEALDIDRNGILTEQDIEGAIGPDRQVPPKRKGLRALFRRGQPTSSARNQPLLHRAAST